MAKFSVKIKRVYEKPQKSDGLRILIDRFWPRGLSKQKARIDFWLQEISPSKNLIKWFGHKPEKWPEFQKRYRQELKKNKQAIAQLKSAIKKHKKATMLFSSHELKYNNAVALKKILKI